MAKKILVVGCGRSGTLFMSKVFEEMGLDVGHERLGKDGISSWFHSFGNRQKRLIQAQMKNDERIYIHIVRNPLKVINSMVKISKLPNRKALQYFKDVCPDETEGIENEYELGMLYWYFWNKMIEKRGAGVTTRIKVEDVSTEKGLKNICNVVGIIYEDSILENIKKLGTNTHEINDRDKARIEIADPLFEEKTLEDLFKINFIYAKNIYELAKKYGYELGY